MMIDKQAPAIEVQKLIQHINQGQLARAEAMAKKLAQLYPTTFVVQHVLALALDGQQKYVEAAVSYQQALKLEPQHAELQFNLGITLTHLNRLAEAEQAYRQAIALNPRFFEAYGNLGTVQQKLGQLSEAIASYRAGLAINPQDARGFFNLGTALRDQGALQEAINSYQQAIKLFPNYTDAYNNLGETYRDDGDMPSAVKNYQASLSLNPQHASANYNMGEFLYLSKQFVEAARYFELSQLDDWQARQLYCLYKAERFTDFKAKLDHIIRHTRHTSPFIATLATHHAVNFGINNEYSFCKHSLDFVYHKSIPALAEPDSVLLKALLHDVKYADIATRSQGMLTNGKQSAGNLFKRPESSFRQLATLVQQAFLDYKQHFSNADCELILSFPQNLEFTSSWYVNMRQGGHLSPHIHEIGWISGAVYLAMPTENGLEGAFEYGVHGDHYPILSGKSVADFPVGRLLPNVGDIVLFPSSLFHRTIPFNADEARICIAFDLKPSQI